MLQWWCAAQGTPWSWSWRPYVGVWLLVGGLVVGYALLLRRLGRSEAGGAAPAARKSLFLSGAALLWAALDWPLGTLGAGYLASAHMVQFLLIALVIPPLLLAGIPDRAYEALQSRPGGHRGLAVLTHPLVALALFGTSIGVTHWPVVVDALMPTQLGSFVMDMAWLATGILFWWPVAAPVPRRAWFGPPMKMGYLFLATVVNTAPFIYLTFSHFPVYATYELAPPGPWLGTRDDQIVAGLLMKMGGALVLWTAITVLFVRWYLTEGREEAFSE